jgi:hypothetical protein
MQRQDKEYIHGQLAVEVARMQGIFPRENKTWHVDNEDQQVDKATANIDSTLAQWQHHLDQTSLVSNEVISDMDEIIHQQSKKPMVVPLSDLSDKPNDNIEQLMEGVEHLTSTDVNNLNEDQ